MNILSGGLLVAYCLFVIIVIINTQRLSKEQEDLNKKSLKLIGDVINLNSKLTCKITTIYSIIEIADKNKELYKVTIEKIKKVLVSDNQSDN